MAIRVNDVCNLKYAVNFNANVVHLFYAAAFAHWEN